MTSVAHNNSDRGVRCEACDCLADELHTVTGAHPLLDRICTQCRDGELCDADFQVTEVNVCTHRKYPSVTVIAVHMAFDVTARVVFTPRTAVMPNGALHVGGWSGARSGLNFVERLQRWAPRSALLREAAAYHLAVLESEHMPDAAEEE